MRRDAVLDVVVAGAAPRPGADAFYRALLARTRTLVAADAGAEWALALGRVPDLVVGDFDSAGPGAPERLRDLGVEVIDHPAHKDRTDLELCAAEVRERGLGAPVFTAAFSLRLDHTLAAVGTVLRCADIGATVLEPGLEGLTLPAGGSLELDLSPGTVFSVVSPTGTAGVTVEGARWPLAGATLAPLDDLGISNVATGPVRIACAAGPLLVLIEGDPGR